MSVDPNWKNNPSHFGHLYWLGEGIRGAGFWIGLGIIMFGFSYCTAHRTEPVIQIDGPKISTAPTNTDGE